METSITPATHDDLPIIFKLFDEAIRYQKENNYIGWKSYDTEFIKADVDRGLLFKVTSGKDLLGIFCICYNDKLIWRERENNDALYLHRIVLNRAFQGVRIFSTILTWARQFAEAHQLQFVRMDTWAENTKLISYYKTYGFRFVENYTTTDTAELPVQHRNLNVALLELALTVSPNAMNADRAKQFTLD